MIPRFKPWLNSREFLALFRPNRGSVKKFERRFASVFNATDAVAFPYGRSALWAFLKSTGIENSEVIMPAYTCSVVAHAITLSGNYPTFVDIDLFDFNMDTDLLQAKITIKTRAIVVTHLFGYPMNVDGIVGSVREAEARFGHKIWIIQDCAHSFGANFDGRPVGETGDVSIYALNISKIMTSIFGGMLTFHNADLADSVRKWRDIHFSRPSTFKSLKRRIYLLAIYIAFWQPIYTLTNWLQSNTSLLDYFTKAFHLDDAIHFPPDYLDKMLDVEALVGLEQLKKYAKNIHQRRENARYYNEMLSSKNGNWVLPPIIDGATYSHYVIRVLDRDHEVRLAKEKGLELGELIQYSVPALASYRDRSALCPKSNVASITTINVPIYPGLTNNQRKKIVEILT